MVFFCGSMSRPALLPPSAAEAAEEAKRVTRWSIALSRCTAMRPWADLLSVDDDMGGL